MKMKLALTAVMAALYSHAALAASEGGDTWSSLEARAYADQMNPVAAAGGSADAGIGGGFPSAANEGGDTWSELGTLAGASARRSAMVAATPLTSGAQRGLPRAASEGGDTWSELQALERAEPMPSLAAAR